MTKRIKLRTARVRLAVCDITLMAQCKSSKAELMRRLIADDPVWRSADVQHSIEPMLAKKSFNRGLAIKAIARVDEVRVCK